MDHSPAPSIVPPSTAPPSSKPPRILACANVKCTPSTPAPARKRRRPNQDLQERLARCEELLKEYATEKPEGQTPSTPSRPPQVPLYDKPTPDWQPAGKLVQEGGGVRFMDNYLVGTIYDELRAMREIIDAEDTEETSQEALSPDENSELILGADSPEKSIEDLWPEAGHVLRLWQVYLDRVNPLTKIIHVPTLQPYLAEAISRSQNVPKSVEALLFSIFVMATISLTPDECQSLLGQSREEALQRYTQGVRLTLLRMNFLTSNDLTTLQALVIYLISLQGRYNRHAAWILNGIVIRMAQKMGLHRDGEILGLGPFDSEMRRRVWWQIIMVDAKYAIFSGLSHSLLPRNWDTKPPKNVNDADIYPSATEPFQDREGPTEMIFCLLTFKFAKFLVETPGLEQLLVAPPTPDAPGGPTDEQLAEYRVTCENLGNELLDMLDKHCDPRAGPVHEMAIEMRKFIIDKVQELITPPKLAKHWGTEVRNAKDNTFRVAIATLEHNEQNYLSSKDKGFIWFSLLHFQLDVFLYMAGQLCHRTEGDLVERAWRQVEVVYTFHPELFDVSNRTFSTLAIFILKAWRRREEVMIHRTGQIPETPFYVEKLRQTMPNDDYKTEPTPPNPYTPASLNEGLEPNGPNFDQFLGSLLDGPSLEWDMFSVSISPVDHKWIALTVDEDRLIISTAIPQITDDFHSVTDIGWYGSAYLITNCAFQLLFGKLYTFFSVKAVYIISILLFEAGSAICGAAPNSLVFIIGRAIGGLGSAGIMAGGFVIIVYAVPLHRRPVFQGLLGAIFGISSVIGPLVGGAFTSKLTWRWCFYINLPFGGVAIAFIAAFLKIPAREDTKISIRRKISQLDLLGTAALLPGTICLLLALQWGGSRYPWPNPRIVALLTIALALLIAFGLVQVYKPATATLAPHIFRHRSIFAGVWCTFCIGSSMMILIYFIPIWFQAIHSESAIRSGIFLVPLCVPMVAGSIFAGSLTSKTGYYTPFLLAGTIFMSIGAGLITTWGTDMTYARPTGYQILYGWGLGLALQAPNLAAQTVLERRDQAIGLTLMIFTQLLGGSVLISVGQNVLTQQLLERLDGVEGFSPELLGSTGATALINDLPLSVRGVALDAYNEALRRVFQVALCVSCLSVLGAAAMEWKSVRVELREAQRTKSDEEEHEMEGATVTVKG
ncbi:hypothetical protein OQA88_6824 [Cercophora sp. LCS_1]